MRHELDDYVEGILGPYRVIGDRSWGHGDSRVIEVRDGAGITWFVKRHHGKDRYCREVSAYRDWAPALGDQAPTLRSHDDALQVLVLSAVPGVADTGRDPEIQRQAGTLLRQLHDAASPARWEDFAAEKRDEFEAWAARAAGLIEVRLLDFARAEVCGLAALGHPVRVPCHLDYSTRNWLVADGRVYIIDFEWAAPEVWVNDLARLYFGPWRDRPDLKDAFLEGYGRTIDPDDRAVLLGCGALTAVRTVVWARDHGDTPFEEAGRQNLQRLMARRY